MPSAQQRSFGAAGRSRWVGSRYEIASASTAKVATASRRGFPEAAGGVVAVWSIAGMGKPVEKAHSILVVGGSRPVSLRVMDSLIRWLYGHRAPDIKWELDTMRALLALMGAPQDRLVPGVGGQVEDPPVHRHHRAAADLLVDPQRVVRAQVDVRPVRVPGPGMAHLGSAGAAGPAHIS